MPVPSFALATAGKPKIYSFLKAPLSAVLFLKNDLLISMSVNKLSPDPVEQPIKKFVTTNLFNMKVFFIPAMLFCITTGHCQFTAATTSRLPEPITFNHVLGTPGTDFSSVTKKVKIVNEDRWRLNGNKLLTGGLLVLSGAAKGFNETLEFNWRGFESVFPKANPQWFYPQFSYKNKYKDGDPAKGPRFPLSTSILVMTTDQYHLNNFIHKASMIAAVVIKIGEGKKPFRHYLFDALYYSACYQVGFGSVYYYFKSRM
jgi:hypothetical protein